MKAGSGAADPGGSAGNVDAGFLYVVAFVGGPMDGRTETQVVRADDDIECDPELAYELQQRVFDATEHEIEKRAIAETGAKDVYDFRIMRWVEKHT